MDSAGDHEFVWGLVYNIAHGSQFPEYEAFGLSYDAASGYMIYDDQTVGYFKDTVKPGTYTKYSDPTGEVSIEVIRNEDGEITSFKTAPL